MSGLVGGIELGGTKTIMALGRGDGTILERHTVPTGEPEDVVAAIAEFFDRHKASHGGIEACAAGAFGPIVLDPDDADYGHLLQTNKRAWSGFDLAGALARACGCEVDLVTDVAAAAVGEGRLGVLGDVPLGIYLTVGTGIGGAIVHNGEPLPALLHPEMGHMAITRHPDDAAPSVCRFHADCAEGLAGGPAIAARFGQPLNQFAPGGTEYVLIAGYLGGLVAQLALALSPHRFVIGGGVSLAPGIIGAVHAAVRETLGDYANRGVDDANYVTAPGLGADSGIIGALSLAAKPARGLARRSIHV